MSNWITTWAQAHADMSALSGKAKDSTARITVFSEISGSQVRIRLSNQEGKTRAVLESASVQIEAGEYTALTFDGKAGLSLEPGYSVYSDSAEVKVRAGEAITISLAFQGAVSSGNNLPECVRLSTRGNYTQSMQMPRARKSLSEKLNGLTPVLPMLSAVEISTEERKEVLVCFGDSITAMSYWTRPLADLLRSAGRNTVVINKGISGNQLLSDPIMRMMALYGKAAVKRFEEDVLNVSGVSAVLFALGVNDLNMSRSIKAVSGKAEAILNALEELSGRAKEKGLKTYAATVTPFGGCTGYRDFTGTEREKLNCLIRGSKAFDGIADFDAIVRDPGHAERMLEIYDSGDHLHPGIIGGKKLAEAVYDILWV